MPRRPRFDAPGLLHHVMNRGIARRRVFETRRDMRYFLALLAVEVRAPQHRHLMQQDRNYARRSAELASAFFEVLRNP